MRLLLTATATTALALVLATPAAAAEKFVQPGSGPCPGADTQCGSIAEAAAGTVSGDTVTIRPKSDGWNESATFGQDGLTLRGDGTGQVRVNGTLTFTGQGTFNVRNLSLFAPAGGPALSFTSNALSGDKTVNVQSSILSGSGANAAIHASTDVSVNTIDVVARHATFADKDGAPTVTEGSNPNAINTTFENSLTPSAAENGALFANPGAEDFHLRVGSPAIDQGGGQVGGEVATDVDGEGRTGTWDRGGDEFVNHNPSAPTLTAFQSSARTGEAVGFDASGATDPDTALQDGIDRYRWSFGDGTVQDLAVTSPNFQQHAYGTPGAYTVTVQALDRAGGVSAPSNPVTVTVTDPPPPPPPGSPGANTVTIGPGGAGLPGIPAAGTQAAAGPDRTPPSLAIAFPAHNQRVRLGRAAPVLRGRNADPSGVRRVELALARRQGTRCLWYDGRRAFRPGACSAVRWFRATVDDFAWRYAFPRNVRPAPGGYGLLVRGTDYLGNGSTLFSSAAKTAIGFTVVR